MAEPTSIDLSRGEDRAIDDLIVGAFNIFQTSDVTVDGFTVTEALEGVWATVSRHVNVRDMMSFANDSSGYYFWSCEDSRVEGSLGYDNAVGIYQGQSGSIDMERCSFTLNRLGRAMPWANRSSSGHGSPSRWRSPRFRCKGHHPEGNPQQPGVMSSKEFPSGSRK